MNIFYILRSGKNCKLLYYAKNYIRLIIPKYFFRRRLQKTLENCKKRPDWNYIQQRVNYYNRIETNSYIKSSNWKNKAYSLKKQKMCKQKVYYFDTFEYTRWFPSYLLYNLCPGDITYVPEIPSIVKSRPLVASNQNSVLMKLDKIRHFIFVKDRKSFTQKQNKIIFRGKIGHPETRDFKENRYRFLQLYWNHPLCNLGEIGSHNCNPQWIVPKTTIHEHLDYKFILSLEGNDVASNLKWIMSSNSLAIMPRPTCETWFMEGTLIPNYHYVEIKADFSDLEERLKYYINHPQEAQQIINHAHEYVKQFKNKKREKLISLLVLKKYFEMTADIQILSEI